MPVSCSVLGCTNRRKRRGPVHFFKFPLKDSIRLQLWIDAVKREGFIPSDSSRICSDHFVGSDFAIKPEESYKMTLKSDAVPSLFLSRSMAASDNLETISLSSSTPEYSDEDWKANQYSEAIFKTDVEINNTYNKRRLSTSDGEVLHVPCGIRCPNSQEPATLRCVQCLIYYHPACVNLNAHLKIIGYVCINCRSIIRQKNRRVQSANTVVVGASEPEQLHVKQILIRQVHQASDSPNSSINKTLISKTEKQIYEHINENNSDINTVICQGKIYKTVMVDGSFHEQYVYEMKQTRGPSLMTCVVQEPKNLDDYHKYSEMNSSFRDLSASMVTMQSFNHMVKAMRHVFKYLKTHELLSASRVCTAWNIIAMNNVLWQAVSLKHSAVYNWDEAFNAMNKHNSVKLDTRRMAVPTEIDKFNTFWLNFILAINKAQNLKSIILYKCPANVVESTISLFPQLKVLNATTINNPNLLDTRNNPDELIVLNLNNLCNMVNLTDLRIKGLNGIKLTNVPSLKYLLNLKFLSLTSIKVFSEYICHSLNTVTTNLEFLEIGDCDCLSEDFAFVLKKFTNLKSLRLENYQGRFVNFSQEVFCSIRGLDNLKTLELINIEFSDIVEDELEKCNKIKALLIIPLYVCQSAITNRHLIDCLKKLSNTLTYLVWGLTLEVVHVTQLFTSHFPQIQHSTNSNYELQSPEKEVTHVIPIMKIRKPRQQSDIESVIDEDFKKSLMDNVDILSVPDFEKLLETTMVNTKTKVVKISFASTTRVRLCDYFNDI